MSLSSALDQLARYRTNNTRASQRIFLEGTRVLKSGTFNGLGDESWSFLEQLALAAIDIGRVDVANECLRQIAAKFPGSPRVEILTGIRLEATESPHTALQYYDELLEADSANGPAWKRRISLLRRLGRVEKTVEELSAFLDTFYTDVEGWLELADIYSSCYQYTSSLQALSHALILAPQNPFIVLQFAETAYTAGDVPLALKMFLLVVDMGERDMEDIQDRPAEGVCIRAWWGVKLCTRRLVMNTASGSASGTAVPRNVKQIDELANERIVGVYSAKEKAEKGVVMGWIGI